jgi:HD-GYP domain-containing protein (c-di-GMP phosphodiesterase class II)
METLQPVSPFEILKQDSLFSEVLNTNPWAADLLKELSEFDEATFNHSVRVARLFTSVVVSEEDTAELKEAKKLAALLHDIGKITIDPQIINKPAKLSDEEVAIMNSHVRESFNSVSKHNMLAAKLLISHHEHQTRPYPRQIKRIEDPLYEVGRDLALADSLDGMLSNDRKYRKDPLAEDSIIQDLANFHPETRVEHFLSVWKRQNTTPIVETELLATL